MVDTDHMMFSHGMSSLCKAFIYIATLISGDVQEVRQLMRDQDTNVTDKNGNTPIHMAAKHGNYRNFE